ncbi:Gfo/Idh/MocA family protein [Lysinibacillus sp. RSDA_15]|uniref:Gfo/Idh/MocA family protein n=1 Tax=Lysinibacillus sp. RSDA_15 TaxID=3391421 RepID=UPI003A4DD241
MSRRLKVGIIGTGSIAQTVHIPNYIRNKDRVELVAVCDIDIQKAKECAHKFDIPFYFSNYEDMLNQVDLDAVSVCTPNKFHTEATIKSLLSGCHVLCEKPPAITHEEAKRMQEIAEKTGKILTYGFHYRYSQEVQTLKKFIDSKELGEIYTIKVCALRRRGIPNWGVFTNKELQGGGPLIDIGVHMLDTALYLMGYPNPDIILASTYQKIGNKKGIGDWDWEKFSVEDFAIGMIKFKNGATLILETSFAANIQKDKMQVSLLGDKGGADLFPLRIYQEKHDVLIDVSPVHTKDIKPRDAEIDDFISCCLSGIQPFSTPKEGAILQRILENFYLSSHLNKSIKF